MTFYFVEVYICKDQSYSPRPSYELKVTYHNSMYIFGIENMTFQVYIGSWCKWSCREGGQCACEHMLDYTNNPEHILTLILHSFIRSLSNFIFCQIRPIFSILIFWSKLKNTGKNVKLALKYQTIKWWRFFFQHSLYFKSSLRKFFIKKYPWWYLIWLLTLVLTYFCPY